MFLHYSHINLHKMFIICFTNDIIEKAIDKYIRSILYFLLQEIQQKYAHARQQTSCTRLFAAKHSHRQLEESPLVVYFLVEIPLVVYDIAKALPPGFFNQPLRRIVPPIFPIFHCLNSCLVGYP